MNAENGKLTAANVAQRLTLFEQKRPPSRWKRHNVLQLSSVTQKADAQHGAGVQRPRGLTSAGVITHPSPDSSPLENGPTGSWCIHPVHSLPPLNTITQLNERRRNRNKRPLFDDSLEAYESECKLS